MRERDAGGGVADLRLQATCFYKQFDIAHKAEQTGRQASEKDHASEGRPSKSPARQV
jgi:hypothetical protein